jgi:hypothetical protein
MGGKPFFYKWTNTLISKIMAELKKDLKNGILTSLATNSFPYLCSDINKPKKP